MKKYAYAALMYAVGFPVLGVLYVHTAIAGWFWRVRREAQANPDQWYYDAHASVLKDGVNRQRQAATLTESTTESK